jgi:NAD+--dinitrogen-reductase ADP-D-ribosyltransferase
VSKDARQAPPQGWLGTNLVGVSTQVLASAAFNAEPLDLTIAGVREAHAGLFSLLAESARFEEARDLFVQYLTEVFGLNRPPVNNLTQQGGARPKRWRSSWRKLLQGWGMDSNGPAAAVLKAWVESRFGLAPSFHKAPLLRYPSPAWMEYVEEKLASARNGNNIYEQLDLLYEYCQWALQHHPFPIGIAPCGQHLRLWRGSNRCEEQIVSGSLQDRHCTVRLNNIVSFSLAQEDASCFGDWVFEVQVPICKVVVFPGMLPGHVLQGEQEVLAIGGEYEVIARYD